MPVTWVSPLGKCFVVDVVEDRVISLGWMLCRYGYSFSIGNSCVDVFFFLTGSACLGVALVGSRLFIIVGKLAFV